ncbi:MAG: hypothetical protein ACRC18_07110 [Cetobacterium sp.]
MKEYEGYKVIKLESEYPSDCKCSWDIVGVKNKYICPECQYLGKLCPSCGGNE